MKIQKPCVYIGTVNRERRGRGLKVEENQFNGGDEIEKEVEVEAWAVGLPGGEASGRRISPCVNTTYILRAAPWFVWLCRI